MPSTPGAGLTALGFGIGGDAWGWLVLAAGVVTLLAGLAAAFGVHRFVAAYLLNIWFIIALAVASGFHHAAHITSYTWAQVLAWADGAALWIVVNFIAWLILGRRDRPRRADRPVLDVHGPRKLAKSGCPHVSRTSDAAQVAVMGLGADRVPAPSGPWRIFRCRSRDRSTGQGPG